MLSSFSSRRALKFGLLAALAVGGSLIFGAAAGAVLPDHASRRPAILLTISTGCSWVLLGGLLLLVTRKAPLDLAEVCLVAMGYGEGVLLAGALVDRVLPIQGLAVPVNVGIVLISNIVMAIVFVRGLGRLGVALGVSVLLWVLGLNGSWPIFLAVAARLLPGAV
jgi:hypothetical protein